MRCVLMKILTHLLPSLPIKNVDVLRYTTVKRTDKGPNKKIGPTYSESPSSQESYRF